jgi:hypothetical protein
VNWLKTSGRSTVKGDSWAVAEAWFAPDWRRIGAFTSVCCHAPAMSWRCRPGCDLNGQDNAFPALLLATVDAQSSMNKSKPAERPGV